jgi:hypothetical protein
MNWNVPTIEDSYWPFIKKISCFNAERSRNVRFQFPNLARPIEEKQKLHAILTLLYTVVHKSHLET